MKFTVFEPGTIDLEVGPNGLMKDTTLSTAVIVSLLTDRRAEPDDRLPVETPRTGSIGPDRRGWCGDALSEAAGDRIGSRLWLLVREKQTEETRRRAETYILEALQWLVTDNVVSLIDVAAGWSSMGRLDARIELTLIDGGQFVANLDDITGEVTYAI